jgi:phosphoenolpyruvate synthase/pyruvate phosphate dikinase
MWLHRSTPRDEGKRLSLLYNDRANSYRVHQGCPADVAASTGQRMVRSDSGIGVMFTIDTESGFEAMAPRLFRWLGENQVQGAVNPDEFYVPPMLTARPRVSVVSNSKLPQMESRPPKKKSGGKLVTHTDADRAARKLFLP